MSEIEDVRNRAKLVQEKLMKKLRAEAKTSEEDIGAEGNGAVYRYHGVLQSI